jgi:two-component system response regulator EvgA
VGTIKPMPVALIVDDNPGFRAAARLLLEQAGYAVVDAENGGDGVIAAAELQPELVLLDVQLPDIDGFEVAERLSSLRPPPAVILTSSRDRRDYGSLVGTPAIRGFIAKGELSVASICALLLG